MKTYDELKQEQKPAGTFDCYTSHRIGNFTKTCIVTIFQWEQVPRSKTKTKVPRYRSLVKAKCDRENWAWQSRLIQDAVDALNDGTVNALDLPDPINSQRAWRGMVLIITHLGKIAIADRGNGNYPEPPPPKITDRPMKQRGF